ncbi:hypothetical protein AB0I02_22030 [Streptomyces phaeochromogenes]
MFQEPFPDAVPSSADILRARYAGRLPSTLADLAGPAHGRVDLPLHVAWSGLRTYDLDEPRQCMGLYRTVLTEGQRDDIASFLNRDLLLALWPRIRTMISRHVRGVWEETFPELQRGVSATG